MKKLIVVAIFTLIKNLFLAVLLVYSWNNSLSLIFPNAVPKIEFLEAFMLALTCHILFHPSEIKSK